MKKILINVSYTDNSGKFWQDSYLKNKVISLDGDIHQRLAEAIKETDGIVLSYKAKPQGNIFIDDKDGQAKAVGYLYRGNTEIYSDEKGKYEKALFDVWVDVKEVIDFPIESIE